MAAKLGVRNEELGVGSGNKELGVDKKLLISKIKKF
jgi:hypothetical protein